MSETGEGQQSLANFTLNEFDTQIKALQAENTRLRSEVTGQKRWAKQVEEDRDYWKAAHGKLAEETSQRELRRTYDIATLQTENAQLTKERDIANEKLQHTPGGDCMSYEELAEEYGKVLADLAAARAEIARAKPALIKAWEIFFTRSFSQDPIGRAEARYVREISHAHNGEEG